LYKAARQHCSSRNSAEQVKLLQHPGNPLRIMGNFVVGHRSTVIFAVGHCSTLLLLMDIPPLGLFAGRHQAE
jgi:hypothetical protein